MAGGSLRLPDRRQPVEPVLMPGGKFPQGSRCPPLRGNHVPSGGRPAPRSGLPFGIGLAPPPTVLLRRLLAVIHHPGHPTRLANAARVWPMRQPRQIRRGSGSDWRVRDNRVAKCAATLHQSTQHPAPNTGTARAGVAEDRSTPASKSRRTARRQVRRTTGPQEAVTVQPPPPLTAHHRSLPTTTHCHRLTTTHCHRLPSTAELAHSRTSSRHRVPRSRRIRRHRGNAGPT